jgi:hypothetical protein
LPANGRFTGQFEYFGIPPVFFTGTSFPSLSASTIIKK